MKNMNMNQILKQAQKMQQQLADAQKKMESVEVTGQAGGGMVQATLSGKGELRQVNIDPELLNPGEREVLQDLIVAAFNDAKKKLDDQYGSEMGGITSGLGLPGDFKLPF